MEIKLPICNVVDFYWQTNTINNAYLINVMETLIWIGYMYSSLLFCMCELIEIKIELIAFILSKFNARIS